MFAALQGLRLVTRESGRLVFETPNAFSRQRLESRRNDLERLCGSFFGGAMRIEIRENEGTRVQSPRPRHEDTRRLRQEALNHPLVNSALEVLEADIVEIRPLGTPPASPAPAGASQ